MEERESKDLKSPKRAGRPSNEERSTFAAIDSEIREMASKLARSLKKEIKNMTVQEKTNLLGRLLPYVCREDENENVDTTMEILVGKYVKQLTSNGKQRTTNNSQLTVKN